MFARKLIPSLFIAAVAVGLNTAPAEAAPKNRNAQLVAGLVAAALNVQTGDITVVDLEGANIPIRILNNALNNNNVEVLTIKDSEVLNDFLNNNDIDVNVLNDLVDIGAIDINIEDNTVELLRNVVVVVNALGGTTIFVP